MLSILLALSFAATMEVQPNLVVSTNWLADNLDQNVVILDVTTRDQYTRAHIPGAILLNSDLLVTRHDNLPNELPAVASLEKLFRNAGVREMNHIIITSNDPLLATRAWFTLDYLGWGDQASILDGGNAKWKAEQRRLVTGLTAPREGNFKANVNPAAVIKLDELKTLMASSEPFVLIDARDPKYFLGQQKGAEVEHAGHIPGAECVPWTANTTAHDHNVRVLLAPELLASAYERFNFTGNTRIVVYCRTGMEATMNYFVLRYLGLRPTLYDGSFVEWNKAESVASAER